MALQVAAQVPAEFRHNGAIANMMVGNDELEEGEASEANDSNYGSDLYFPHLEDKLTEVLGHARKDFEGGIYAEKLGSKFGGYGTFLPTVPAGPPPSGPPPAPPRVKSSPSAHALALASAPSEAVKAPDAVKPAPEPCTDSKKTSSITLKIKVGSDTRGKNSAIYNRLGFSSPSISEDDDEGMSGSESSPERSPTSMIQEILSHRIPADGLLSPLPDFFSSPFLKSGSKTAAIAKEVVREEPRKQLKKASKDVVKVKPQEAGAGKPSSKKESSAAAAVAGMSSKQSSKGRRDEDVETSKKKHKPSSGTPGKPEEKKRAPQSKSKSHTSTREEEPRAKSKLKAGAEPPPAAAAPAPGFLPSLEPPLEQPISTLEAALPPVIKENWVSCDECNRWRLLPPTMDPPKQSDRWLCEMSTWLPLGMNNCKFSEESTTAAVYSSLGIQYPPDPLLVPGVHGVVAAAPVVPAPVAPVPAPTMKRVEEPPVKLPKPSKQVVKKKDKSKQQQVEADVAKSSKKKRGPSDENPTSSSKKLKSEEVRRVEDDVESLERVRKPMFRPDDSKSSRKGEKKEQKGAVDVSKVEEEREEQKEARKSAAEPHAGKKSSRPEKTSSKSKPARPADDAEIQVRARPSSRPAEAKDQKRKLALGSCSPQVADSLEVLRSRAADSSAEPRISDGGEFSNHDRKNDRAQAQKRVSDPAGDTVLEPPQRAKQAVDHPKESRREHRKATLDCLEAKNEDRKDASSLASVCIKAGTSLKHTADRLKDETATDIYLQAALKFLQGAALVESNVLYNETALLFIFCATKYERVNDMAGAVLAYKCAAVARFRLLMVKSSAMTKDRADIEAALNRAPAQSQATPPTEESPSSSSASDLDNLNSVEKMLTNSGKSVVSPLVRGAESLPSTILPTLHRFLRNTGDIFEALEISSKADALLASVGAGKLLSAEKVAAVERVGSIGFNDVEALVRIVNQALEALGR